MSQDGLGFDIEQRVVAPYVYASREMDEEDRGIHKELVKVERERMVLDARTMSLLQRAADRDLHRKRGHATLVQYMELELGYTRHTANEYCRVAEAIKRLLLCNEALWDRDVHFSKIREISRIATPETEYEWLAKARQVSAHKLESLVAGRKVGDGPEDPSDPQIRRSPLRFEAVPATRAFLRQTRLQLEKQLGKRMTDDEFLMTMARGSLAPGSHDAKHSDGSGRPAYQMSISTCRDCKRSWTIGAGEEHDIDDATLEKAQCDAEHLGDVEAPFLQRIRATVSQALRRHIFARDNERCCVPGCQFVYNIDLHHLKFQCHGGKHDKSNLTLLCGVHHQLLHEGKLTITGEAPHALVFTWKALEEDDSPPEPGYDRWAQVQQANLDEVREEPEREVPPSHVGPTEAAGEGNDLPERVHTEMQARSHRSHVGPRHWETEHQRIIDIYSRANHEAS